MLQGVDPGKGAHAARHCTHATLQHQPLTRTYTCCWPSGQQPPDSSPKRAPSSTPATAGGWLQVAAKHMPMGSLILGVDLVPIKPIRGVKLLLSDITTPECRALLKREAGGGKFDVVLHDGAPNVGGAWASEAYSQVRIDSSN